MAGRKKKTGINAGIAILVAVIAAIAAIPKEIWIVVGVVGAFVFIIWLILKSQKGKSKPASMDGYTMGTLVEMKSTTARPLQNNKNTFHQSEAIAASTTTRLRPTSSGQSTTRWIPANEIIHIASMQISGGLVYFGEHLHSASRATEPSLINPKLAVDKGTVDLAVRQMPYWPSYSEISPTARRAYLNWLASGRRDPNADVGYVFLFFYGLERRALVDAASDSKAAAELPAIQAEVRRLLDIYGTSSSFRSYAGHFIDYLATQHLGHTAEDRVPEIPASRQLSIALKIGLGKMAVAGCPVPADWAYVWIHSDPGIAVPRPVLRCESEFKKLFYIEYQSRYGDGLKLQMNRTRLKCTYRPASNGFGREFSTNIGNLPDISAVVTPTKKLQALVTECATALLPYARLLGKSPEKEGTVEGLLLLPRSLWPADALRSVLELAKQVDNEMTSITLGELVTILGGSATLTRERIRALSHALAEFEIGIEPDVASGAPTPKISDPIVLFRVSSSDGESTGDTPAYHAASITLDLACGVAMADGECSHHERLFLTKQIDSWAHLTPAQRSRLKARMLLGIQNPPSLQSLKKKLDIVPTEARRAMARLLAMLAQADGVIAPAEVKLLEKIYRLLGLDTQLAYADLNTAQVPPAATPDVKGTIARPTRSEQPKTGLVLDAAKIQALQQETERVATLLAAVFSDEPPMVPAAPLDDFRLSEETESTTPSPDLLGLDAEHSAFLRLLMTRTTWSRQELADAAADMELMLDGALERINEAALDTVDATLLDGDDPIEVSQEVLEKISA